MLDDDTESMKGTRTFSWFTGALLTGALLLGSCSVSTQQFTELTLWLDTNEREIHYFKQMANQLRERYPSYRLKMRFISFDDMKPRFQGQVGETHEPDVLYMMNDWVGELVEQNLLRPLTLDSEGLSSLSLNSMRYHGKQYGAPFVYQTLALVYNKNRLSEPPQTPQTLFDLQTEEREPGAYALLYDQRNFYYHAPWFHACGGQLFDGRGRLAIKEKPLLDSILWAQTLQKKKVVPLGTSYSAMVNLFSDAQADLMITGPWSLAVLDDNQLSYGVAPLPQSSCVGKSKPFLGVKGFGLNQLSEHPVEAQNIIRFFVSKVAQQKALEVLDNLPVREDILVQELSADKMAFKKQLKDSVPMPNYPLMKYVWQEMNFLLNQSLTSEQPLSQAQLRQQVKKTLTRLQAEAQKYESP